MNNIQKFREDQHKQISWYTPQKNIETKCKNFEF